MNIYDHSTSNFNYAQKKGMIFVVSCEIYSLPHRGTQMSQITQICRLKESEWRKNVQELELHLKCIYRSLLKAHMTVQQLCYCRHTHSFSPLHVALKDNINYIIFDLEPEVLHLFLEIIYLLHGCNHNHHHCSGDN